jgi:predicted RNA-binding Zn-ribbon protein involved in translation (DUF1610 family)
MSPQGRGRSGSFEFDAEYRTIINNEMESSSSMVYCPRCGKQNPDDSAFCNNCGANLTTGKTYQKDWDDRCGEECSGRSKIGIWFWGIIVILIGVWFLFEFGIKNIEGLPSWVYDLEWGWIFAIVIGVAILAAGINMIRRGLKKKEDQ